MQMLITPAGNVRCLYGEEIELHRLGRLTISRGSHVEPDAGWRSSSGTVSTSLRSPSR